MPKFDSETGEPIVEKEVEEAVPTPQPKTIEEAVEILKKHFVTREEYDTLHAKLRKAINTL
jgi:hypothetical protein